MKRNAILIGLTLMLGFTVSSCTDNEETNPINKLQQEELKAKTEVLSTAVETISNSQGFEIITLKGKTKEGEAEDQNGIKITLDDVKGEYVYQKESKSVGNGHFSDFKKVKDTTLFIMKMPKEIIHKPWEVRRTKTEGDEEMKNNFMVTTKKYLYERVTTPSSFMYNLESDIKSDSIDVGTLAINWAMKGEMDINYDAQFKFPEEFLIGADLDLSENNVAYEYFLMHGDKTLYKEKCTIDSDSSNFTYSLNIGNIEIKLENGKYIILRDDKEEKDVKIEVVAPDNGKTKVSRRLMGVAMFFASNFDLKITFANGDVIILSELVGKETLVKMNKLFDSMYDMYFVKNIVDRVAMQVYFMNKTEQ